MPGIWKSTNGIIFKTDGCPNFVKADIEKARKRINDDYQEDDIPISS